MRGKREMTPSVGSAGSAPKGTKRSGMDTILIILGVFVLAFIVCMIVIFCWKGAVPDTLIQYTLGATGLESFAMAAIKISKVRKGENTEH